MNELKRPAVAETACANFPAVAELERVLAARVGHSDKPFLAAIDGRCGAGKTTLAATLAARHGWTVAHTDDFFLRPCQRTPERYAEPGGNLDRERFLEEVLLPLRNALPARYRPFDCRSMELREPILLEPSPVILVEGSYSCHPLFWSSYALRVFLTIGPETQRTRILRRNGPEKAALFASRWIPMEERYFEAFSIARRCDLVLWNE